jgi:hypothetical protein
MNNEQETKEEKVSKLKEHLIQIESAFNSGSGNARQLQSLYVARAKVIEEIALLERAE